MGLADKSGNQLFSAASLGNVLGFRAPTGYIIAGFGSLIFLLFGGYDEWWHGRKEAGCQRRCPRSSNGRGDWKQS